jgi:hypothetical protein
MAFGTSALRGGQRPRAVSTALGKNVAPVRQPSSL